MPSACHCALQAFLEFQPLLQPAFHHSVFWLNCVRKVVIFRIINTKIIYNKRRKYIRFTMSIDVCLPPLIRVKGRSYRVNSHPSVMEGEYQHAGLLNEPETAESEGEEVRTHNTHA